MVLLTLVRTTGNREWEPIKMQIPNQGKNKAKKKKITNYGTFPWDILREHFGHYLCIYICPEVLPGRDFDLGRDTNFAGDKFCPEKISGFFPGP